MTTFEARPGRVSMSSKIRGSLHRSQQAFRGFAFEQIASCESEFCERGVETQGTAKNDKQACSSTGYACLYTSKQVSLRQCRRRAMSFAAVSLETAACDEGKMMVNTKRGLRKTQKDSARKCHVGCDGLVMRSLPLWAVDGKVFYVLPLLQTCNFYDTRKSTRTYGKAACCAGENIGIFTNDL